MALIDSLTSCIGMTTSQMITERKRQGYGFFDGTPFRGLVHYSFRQNFPELKYELTLQNWVENNIVGGCEIDYTDDDGVYFLKDELEQALIDIGLKYEIRPFSSRYHGGNTMMGGYFLPNGERINLHNREIERIPDEYITTQNRFR